MLRRALASALHVGDPEAAFDRALLLDRQAVLSRQIPVMYVVLLVNVGTLAVLTTDASSAVTRLEVPIALSAIVVWRLIFTYRRRGIPISPHEAAAEQRRMITRSAVLSIGYTLWVSTAIGSGSATQDAIAAMLAYVSALGCAFGLASLPGAAWAAILLATMPVGLQMLASSNPLLAGLGVNLILASILAMRMLTHYHASFLAGVRARLLLAEENQRARAAEENAAWLARTDQLTGLVNRRGFHETLEAAVRDSARPFALFLLDLNGFKGVNDTHGHPAGDALLVECGRRLKAAVAGDDVVARLGGDEFAVISWDAASRGTADQIGDRVCDGLCAPVAIADDCRVRISASLGYCLYPEESRSSAALLARADERLYARKRARAKPSMRDRRQALV